MNRQLIAILIFSSLAINLFAQHPTGIRQLSEQERERILQDAVEYEPPQTRAEPPSRVVNQTHLPKVWSQGQLGICGSFSPTYYLRNYYESKRLGEGRWDYEKDTEKIVSPTWSIIMVQHGDGTWINGASPLETIEKLCKFGYRTLAEMPFYGTDQDWYLPSAAEQFSALRHKGGKLVRLYNITKPYGLLKLKQALAAGEIFTVITDRIPPNFDNYPSGGVSEEVTLEDGKTITVNSNNHGIFVWPSTIAPNETRDPHALTIIGYDDEMSYTAKDGTQKKGALLAVNSWGTNWGVSVNGEYGYIWFAYDSFLLHHFLDGEVLSMTIGDGNYVPLMTATIAFSCKGNPQGWKQRMMGEYGRFWPGGFDYTINGQKLDNPLWPCNLYDQGIESDPTRAEALIDLSGFEDTRLWQFDIYMGFGAEHDAVGKILQTDFHDAAGNLIRSVPPDTVVKAYSSSYPSFRISVPTLRETEDVLPPLFPQTGSIQFGDLNGDGLPDAVSSVRQDNGIEEGVINNDGYLRFIEFRHSVWLRYEDGSWEESLLELGDATAELILVDLDGDNVLDIAASDGTTTFFLKNDGKGKFTKLASIEHRNGEYEAQGVPGYFTTADLDNDGRPDFILLNTAGTQVIHQESPSQYTVFPVGFQKFRSLPAFAHGMAAGDVNGDGWTDFAVSGENTYGSTVHILYINNGGLRFTPYEMPLPHSQYTSIAIADADQDGCDDLLICGLSDTVRILRGRPNDAKGNVQLPIPCPITVGFPPSWGGNAAWADVDMDGRLEVILDGDRRNGVPQGYNTDPYGESYMDNFPLTDIERNALTVLSWDGEKYADSHLALPGTVGFFGPSPMAVVDFDGDGKPDIVHGGLFYCRSEVVTGRQGPSRKVTGMKYVHNEVDATNAAPSSPTELSAKDAKNGKAVFSWPDATDAETTAGGLRYFLRVGTASGKDDVVAESNPFARKSGVTLTNLPAKKLYWAVRTVDATGNLSPWSAEATVTPSGTTPKPTALTFDNLPEMIGLQEFDANIVYNTACSSADESQGTAFIYYGTYKYGELVRLNATPNPGYRFAYWEGPVLEPLSHVSKAYYHGTEKFIAHFMPDTSFLHASENATGYRDGNGNLWLLGTYNNINGTVVQDTPPQFAAAAYTLYFALANDTAYYGSVGPGSASDYYKNSKYGEYHWSRTAGSNHVLRSVDGSDWCGRETPTDKEHIERAWGGPGGLAVLHAGRTLSVIGGAESNNDSISVLDDEDIIECAVQKGFVLLLTSHGVVKGIGDNEHFQIGATAPQFFSQYTEIKGLPMIVAIAAGEAFGAALDTEGNIWTWGDNRKGQLGRGTVGASYQTPAKITGLTAKTIAITAGDNHLVAIDENGELHAYGDNAKGQLGAANGLPLAGKKITAVAAAVDHTVAIDDNGELYFWGDGDVAPRILDNVKFTPVQFTLDIDNRYAHLLPMAAGNYAGRSGQPITITANSDDENYFQYWMVNGEPVANNPLVINPTDNFTVKAFFASRPAVLTLGEPIIGDRDITIPVMMSNSQTTYDGMDFTLEFSNDLKFNELKFTYPIPSYTPQFEMASDSDDMAAIRFQTYGGYDSEKLFNRDKQESNVELFKLVFVKPIKTMDATVKLTGTPLFSRDYGRYAEDAALGDPTIRIIHIEEEDNGSSYDEKFKLFSLSNLKPKTWNVFWLPGDIGITTAKDLRYALGVSYLVAWTWDGQQYRQADNIAPFQPLFLYFIGQPFETLPYIECDIPPIILKTGWNMVVVPQKTPLPADTRAVFHLDKTARAYTYHEGALLPNELYWIFKKNN